MYTGFGIFVTLVTEMPNKYNQDLKANAMPRQPNEWYIRAIEEADDAGIQSIFSEFLPMNVSYVCSNNGTVDDAKDIFMDALEAIFRKVKSGAFELTCSFSTYLFEVCKRLWLKKLRRKKFDAGVTSDDPVVSILVDQIEPQLDQTERYKLMREKFALLPEDCRKVLDLSWHTDQNLEQIAGVMGWTYAYIRKRKSMCTEKLTGLVRGDDRYRELTQ